MTSLAETLASRFRIRGLEFKSDASGLTRAMITTPICRGELFLHGAHVTAFQPAGHDPVLWVSEKSHFANGKAIRGGVPICFPWFGPLASDPKAPGHGFARTKAWDFVAASDTNEGGISVSLQTTIEDFELRFSVAFGRELQMSLQVTLAGSAKKPATFEEALHTYFAVGDIRMVAIQGLESTPFIDKVDGAQTKPAEGVALKFLGETDRVYLDTTSACILHDAVLDRSIWVGKSNSKSTVVWNPWIDKSAKMADFGDDEWPGMVCIETANVGPNSITLKPAESHTMSVIIAIG